MRGRLENAGGALVMIGVSLETTAESRALRLQKRVCLTVISTNEVRRNLIAVQVSS